MLAIHDHDLGNLAVFYQIFNRSKTTNLVHQLLKNLFLRIGRRNVVAMLMKKFFELFGNLTDNARRAVIGNLKTMKIEWFFEFFVKNDFEVYQCLRFGSIMNLNDLTGH